MFETFRDTFLSHYKLDAAHFYIAPGLAWQALLKIAAEYSEYELKPKGCELCLDEFRLELLTDIDMLLMVEKGVQGGITLAVTRYAKANNKYMKDLDNPNEESEYLQYLNVNNLYGWAVVQKLPTHGFLWKEAEDFNSEKINELVKKDKSGYLLEVNLEHLKNMHKNHNELPFLAERMKIGKVKKVVPNLKDNK